MADLTCFRPSMMGEQALSLSMADKLSNSHNSDVNNACTTEARCSRSSRSATDSRLSTRSSGSAFSITRYPSASNRARTGSASDNRDYGFYLSELQELCVSQV